MQIKTKTRHEFTAFRMAITKKTHPIKCRQRYEAD